MFRRLASVPAHVDLDMILNTLAVEVSTHRERPPWRTTMRNEDAVCALYACVCPDALRAPARMTRIPGGMG